MRGGKWGAAMEKQWWCVNCLTPIELDIHGRCSTCGSDAVDRIERGAFLRNATRTRATPLTAPSVVSGQHERPHTFAAVAGAGSASK